MMAGSNRQFNILGFASNIQYLTFLKENFKENLIYYKFLFFFFLFFFYY